MDHEQHVISRALQGVNLGQPPGRIAGDDQHIADFDRCAFQVPRRTAGDIDHRRGAEHAGQRLDQLHGAKVVAPRGRRCICAPGQQRLVGCPCGLEVTDVRRLEQDARKLFIVRGGVVVIGQRLHGRLRRETRFVAHQALADGGVPHEGFDRRNVKHLVGLAQRVRGRGLRPGALAAVEELIGVQAGVAHGAPVAHERALGKLMWGCAVAGLLLCTCCGGCADRPCARCDC